MVKAVDAFRTIGEVSDDLDVPKHVLRFWEGRFPQLKPMKRGGGRRFYRPDDVALLRGIHHLLHKAGYTIKGVQRLLKEHGADSIKIADGMTAPGIVVTATPEPSKAASSTGGRGRKAKVADSALSAEHRTVLVKIAAELETCLDHLRSD